MAERVKRSRSYESNKTQAESSESQSEIITARTWEDVGRGRCIDGDV